MWNDTERSERSLIDQIEEVALRRLRARIRGLKLGEIIDRNVALVPEFGFAMLAYEERESVAAVAVALEAQLLDAFKDVAINEAVRLFLVRFEEALEKAD